ncbi:MAG: formylglycine-generating enzyme family protein [Gemmatimonadetes bacterium]|nr:formylglycine-generating enzyme family protein [Gemmatimonadota bacterium]MYC69821.1 formylglycine-generating enzyme family protein [Gemmatimonadota bacterium]
MKSLVVCLLGLLMLVACGGDESPTGAGGRGNSTGAEKTFSLPNGAEMAFVWIEPGVFQMGSPSSEKDRWDDEEPVHEVEISKGFWLGKYEVTQGEWEAVMGINPSHFEGTDLRPVERVSWYDVHEFIGRLNAAVGDSLYRLPSEAEWEYACRAGSTTRWSFGDDESQLADYAWYDCNDGCDTEAVGLKLPNAWGLYDMHGNVWEWVQDWYEADYYNSSPRVDPLPLGPGRGSLRVIRGGDFGNGALNVRSANRSNSSPDYRDDFVGVRLVRIR